jgi:hypothetical protein
MSDLFIENRGHGDLHRAPRHGRAIHGDLLEPLFDVPGGRGERRAVGS